MDPMSSYNIQFVERLLHDYCRDPKSVSPSWREWFDGINGRCVAPQNSPPSAKRRSVFNPLAVADAPQRQEIETARLQGRVEQMVAAYRHRGHLAAKLDPLGMARPNPADLSHEAFGLSDADLDRSCVASIGGRSQRQKVGDVATRLRDAYCGHLGVQYMHIDDPAVCDWLQQRIEANAGRADLSRDEQLRILRRLTDAEVFEEFVRKKYVGAKTFSIEGAESLIPLLDLAVEHAARQGIEEIVVGMAHRGRLNVLSNIIGKRSLDIFWEFNDPRPDLHRGRGDVKYHLGFSGDWKANGGKQVHLSLCFNSSHLEFVNPIALGRMRAKQQRAGRDAQQRGMVVLIHGDAGFAGEGIVQEALNLSQLEDYAVGGTLHVIVNNQLGFTASAAERRSTRYPSDVARMLQIPIFHINGEHPEAVARAVELAMEFRNAFRRDAIIDLFCFRRWGHNEGDEPSFTQPLMYKAIEHHESVRDAFLKRLVALNGFTRKEADRFAADRREKLAREFEQAQNEEYQPESHSLSGVWAGYAGGKEPLDDDPETGVDRETLGRLLRKLIEIPAGFHLHQKLRRSIERRRKMADGEEPLDWSTAEALAIATLAVEGHSIRLTGQDTARGTFSQRHAVLHDVVDGKRYAVFQRLAEGQARVDVVNSPLCEAAALGFEYGFSLDCPEALVAWEAQYGDFANAAQTIIDQFVASAEDKWRRLSGLVMLLPHGFEGMGPEHSSARLERFLTLAAEDNLQIVVPSTPAQYFHVLRRQIKRRWRKPLVVLTPKSLLRNRQVVSTIDECAKGRFRRILAEPHDSSVDVDRILLCSGKVYYDLLKFRDEHDRSDVAIFRVEQLYPLRDSALEEALQSMTDGAPVVWVQEEPENQGAWRYWRVRFGAEIAGHRLSVVARTESASPATGSKESHQREQDDLVAGAFERPVA